MMGHGVSESNETQRVTNTEIESEEECVNER